MAATAPLGAEGVPRDDPAVRALSELADLIAASARSPRQRDRIVRAARAPLTGAGLVALRAVERHGPIAVSEVARRLELDQSTASRQIRPLEEQGLVTRSVDPADRRAARLAITPKGRRLLDRVREVPLNDYAVALSDWSTDDRAVLARLLDRLRDGLLRTRADETGWAVRKDPA
ncbi:MAG TPA: MarR family transcriptional regulator [Acidimicrobiia bacterium]|nr:MarR family transcriptional regulator [Acidimicrobiia bacterium]